MSQAQIVDERALLLPGGKPASRTQAVRAYLADEIDVSKATAPLLLQSFLSGLIDGAFFGVLNCWQGFMTGNLVQISGNIADFIHRRNQSFPLEGVERLVALACFFLGSLTGGRIGARWGDKKRSWLVATTLTQAVLLSGAALVMLTQPRPLVPDWNWGPAVLAMTSFAMGLQAIASSRLSSPAFATTVVFTAAVTQIAGDAKLFHWPSSETKQRDHRIMALLSLILGAAIGQTLVIWTDLEGAVGAMIILKVVVAFLW